MSWRYVRGAGRGSTQPGGMPNPGCCKGGPAERARPCIPGMRGTSFLPEPVSYTCFKMLLLAPSLAGC